MYIEIIRLRYKKSYARENALGAWRRTVLGNLGPLPYMAMKSYYHQGVEKEKHP